MIEQFSSEELKMMDDYRRIYGPNDGARLLGDNWAPMSKILIPWEKAKSNHLYRLLDNQFIISKKVEYVKDIEDILEEIINFKSSYSFENTRKLHSGEEFINAFCDLITQLSEGNYDWKYKALNYIADLALAKNSYPMKLIDFPLPDGKMIRTNAGAKPMKTLAKIAKAYNLPGFEEFRIGHSLILNQKKVCGRLSLSIHPMDYMTMSDNDCGWESCMQWTGEGSYRQGTVEMMNSPTVVVAYLNAEESYNLGNGQQWTNKKWRQLFVVDRNCLVAVKAYPYQNDDLTKTVMDWIVELAKDNLGWEFAEPRFINPENPKALYFEELADDNSGYVNLDLETGYMYNDWATLKEHLVAPTLHLDKSRLCALQGTLMLPYSGVDECMMCGETSTDYDDESCLICDNCMKFSCCECCGERMGPDEGYSIDGAVLCNYCYDNNVYSCDCCGEEHLSSNMKSIRVLPRLSVEYMNNARENWENMSDFDKGPRFSDLVEPIEFNFYIPHESYWICDCKDCENSWKKTYLKEGADIHRAEIFWDRDNFIYLDDLNNEAFGYMLFNFRDKKEEESVEHYNQAYIEHLEEFGRKCYPMKKYF